MNPDYSDIRFTDSQSRLLPYWIQDSNNTEAGVWVKLPKIYKYTNITMYYGNQMPSQEAMETACLSSFDDFNDDQ